MGRVERIAGSEPHVSTPTGLMKWSVLWYNPKNGKVKQVRCGTDLTEAVRVYGLAKAGGRSQVTLRCDNMGFPPPVKFMPHSVYVVTEEKYRTPAGKKKTLEKRELQHRTPMDTANRRGIFWCPYCREMRKFQLLHQFFYDGRWVPDPDRRGGLYCPMCGISHRDGYVRRWNPIAERHHGSAASTRTRRTV